MRMTIYTANCRGNAKNSLYPNKRVIDNEDDCLEVMAFDHVCAEFKNYRRSNDNFVSSDVEVMDCDNDHSDHPADWIHPENLAERIGQDVAFAVVTSRNNGKPKDGKSARPRFHVYFPHDPVTDGESCAALKKAIQQRFPFFDGNAIDSARFIFGNPVEEILWHEGEITIDCIVKPQEKGIPQGQRNSTMSHFAGRVVKRYGATEKAHEIFMEEAAKCNPPLDDEELAAIWQSACRFAEKVQGQEGYVAPEAYNDEFCRESLKPSDYSDIGQAKVLTREYGVELRYTAATDYLRFCGQYWVESKQQAVGAAEEFLDLQLADAKDEVMRTKEALMNAGVAEDDIASGGKALEKKIGSGQTEAYLAYLSAMAYMAFVMKRRDMKYVVSALQAAKPMLEIGVSDLDRDGFLLNTPDGTYYLPDGLDGRRDHSPEDYITKITAAGPGDKGKGLWLDALDTIFCGDSALIDYVQQIVGMAAVGKVYMESLIIAYGEGRNGKSTFWNAIARVIGTYSGNMSADTLTVGCKRNVKPELAEAKGKRKPKEEWYRVENTHEAIISEDVFRQVQEQIASRRRRQKDGTTQIFSGLVKCADCGWSLAYGENKQNKTPYGYYHCSKNGQGLRQCSMHYIRYDVLYAYVLSRLQYWSGQAQQDEDKLLKRLLNASDKERSSAKKKQASELKKAEKRKAEVDGLFAKMYEDWSAGRITEYNFNMLSEKYQGEQKELDEKIRQLHEAMEAAAQTAVDAEKWVGLMKQYVKPTELTAELLNTLIEKILVHEAVKGEDGSREQEVEIFYRFIGKID